MHTNICMENCNNARIRWFGLFTSKLCFVRIWGLEQMMLFSKTEKSKSKQICSCMFFLTFFF